VKTILVTITILLAWTVSLSAAELKVKVPVEEFEQMKSRIDALENENSRLKQEVGSMGGSISSSQPSEELKSRLSDLEREKSQLERDKNQLESENSQLKQQVSTIESSKQASQPAPAPAPDSAGMQSEITALENKNRRLRNQVKKLKEGGVAASLSEDRRPARHVYAVETKRNFSHPFKF